MLPHDGNWQKRVGFLPLHLELAGFAKNLAKKNEVAHECKSSFFTQVNAFTGVILKKSRKFCSRSGWKNTPEINNQKQTH